MRGVRYRKNKWEVAFNRKKEYKYLGAFNTQMEAECVAYNFLENEFESNLNSIGLNKFDILETKYENTFVSNTGLVINKYGLVIKGFTDKCGYKEATIYFNGKQKTILVHRLVLETFTPTNQMDSLDVNHINGVKTDNKLSNLEWCTRSQNIIHSYKNYLQDNVTNQYGNFSIISESDIEYVKNNLWRTFITQKILGDYFSLTKKQIQDILSNGVDNPHSAEIKHLWSKKATYKILGDEIGKCGKSIKNIKTRIGEQFNYEIYEHISNELRECLTRTSKSYE
jgi:hypothetical protein